MNEKPVRPEQPLGVNPENSGIKNTGSAESSKETYTASEIKASKKQEKTLRPWYKKKRFWLIGIFALPLIVGIFQDDSENAGDGTNNAESQDGGVVVESESPQTSNEAPQAGGETPKDESPQGRLADAVFEETGKTNIKGYGDRVQLVEWSDEQTLIRLLGDENITDGTTKSSNRRLVLETISAYQQSGLSSEIIAIEIFYPLIDNLGNESLYKVLGYGFTQERITQISSQNIDTKRMDTNFADIFTIIHPSFRW